MADPALTTDRKVLSHLKPINVQVWADDQANWDTLSRYVWNIGMSDFEGNIVYDFKRTLMGDLSQINEEGGIIFPRKLVDPRGGALTLIGLRLGDPGEDASRVQNTARFGAAVNSRLIFQATTVRSSRTVTDNSPSDKVTVGGKAGLSYGIGSGEISGSREHGAATNSRADTEPGKLLSIVVVWITK